MTQYSLTKVPGFSNKGFTEVSEADDGWGFGVWEYSFALDGGTAGTDIPLRLIAGTAIPAHAIVVDAVVDVLTALNGAGGCQVGLFIEAYNDVVFDGTLAGGRWNQTGRTAISSFLLGIAFGAGALLRDTTIVKTTAERTPKMDVVAANVTAGKYRFGVRWMVSAA